MSQLASIPLPQDLENKVVSQLGALAHAGRLAIFRELVKVWDASRSNHGLAAGELARRMNIAPPTLSFHLKELSRADLVTTEKQGRSVIYRINGASIRALVDFLLEDCCSECC